MRLVRNSSIGENNKPSVPEPAGTIVLMAFRINGYRSACDGSLMAELENIDGAGEETGWVETHIGLYPENALVITLEELETLFKGKKE